MSRKKIRKPPRPAQVRGPEGDFALTFAEIGLELGIPQVTVQAIFTRAIRKLIARGALKEFAPEVLDD